MKHLIPILALSFVLLAGCSNVAANEALVEGKIEGVRYETITVSRVNTASGELVTTVPVGVDNSFSINLQLKEPDFYLFEFRSSNGQRAPIGFSVKPGDKVKIDLELRDGVLCLKKVKGSKEAELLKLHRDVEVKNVTVLNALQREFVQSNDQAVKDAVRTQYMQLLDKSINSLDSLLSAYVERPTAVFLAYSDFSTAIFDHFELFKALDSLHYQNNKGKFIHERIHTVVNNPVAPGKVAPDIEGNDPNGVLRKLSDLRGKVVLLDFWASWCAPCRAENPNVVAAYNQYKDKGFEVFSVSLDRDAEAWKNAIKADGLVWENHVSTLQHWNCPLAKTYGVSSIPFSVLIDKDGKIIAVGLRGKDLANKLQQVLGD